MAWEIEGTDEFAAWFDALSQGKSALSGDKTGDGRWYEKHVPLADDLYDVHLVQLQREGLI